MKDPLLLCQFAAVLGSSGGRRDERRCYLGKNLHSPGSYTTIHFVTGLGSCLGSWSTKQRTEQDTKSSSAINDLFERKEIRYAPQCRREPMRGAQSPEGP